MEFTSKERNTFSEWAKDGYSSWANDRTERSKALTREFVKTLTDEQIKSWFYTQRRNQVEPKNEVVYAEMIKFLNVAMKELNIQPKKKDKEVAIESFNGSYDLNVCGDTALRVLSIISIKTDGLTLQDVLNSTFEGGYYSIPYGQPRTIEHNHNAKVLHAIYNKFGGVAIIKTARKIIGVKMETGQKNSACPIPIIQAISILKEMRDERVKEFAVDDLALKELKEKCEMDEVVKKI